MDVVSRGGRTVTPWWLHPYIVIDETRTRVCCGVPEKRKVKNCNGIAYVLDVVDCAEGEAMATSIIFGVNEGSEHA